jgi:hypothetical protein
MNIRLLIAAAIALLGVVGCNSSGTCIYTKVEKMEGYDASCTINATKEMCANDADHQFFPEEGTAGLMRCKSLGYDFITPPKGTDPKAVQILYRPAGSGAAKK